VRGHAPRKGDGVSPTTAVPRAIESRALAFSSVYASHAAFVRRSLRRLGVHAADVEDGCQDTFVVVHRRLNDYDGSAAVRTWLFGITRRVAADYRKRAHRRHEAPAAAEPVIEATQVRELDRRRARAVLDRILDQLDEDKRSVFVQYELEEVPMNDVALAAACPLQTAYSRLAAARRQVDAAVRRHQRSAAQVRAAG
jgi:RNA polymerase sigma-70 factor (ECF subfamily)